MTNRKKLAKQYGIKNYKGTASQNTTLLSKIKGDKPSASTASKAKANLKVDGYLGIQSIKAIQRYFGTTVDGVLSKPSYISNQKATEAIRCHSGWNHGEEYNIRNAETLWDSCRW